jgi:hypothetical protein
MRKVDAAAMAVSKNPLRAAERHEAAVQLVCLALALAMIALASRIFSVW